MEQRFQRIEEKNHPLTTEFLDAAQRKLFVLVEELRCEPALGATFHEAAPSEKLVISVLEAARAALDGIRELPLPDQEAQDRQVRFDIGTFNSSLCKELNALSETPSFSLFSKESEGSAFERMREELYRIGVELCRIYEGGYETPSAAELFSKISDQVLALQRYGLRCLGQEGEEHTAAREDLRKSESSHIATFVELFRIRDLQELSSLVSDAESITDPNPMLVRLAADLSAQQAEVRAELVRRQRDDQWKGGESSMAAAAERWASNAALIFDYLHSEGSDLPEDLRDGSLLVESIRMRWAAFSCTVSSHFAPHILPELFTRFDPVRMVKTINAREGGTPEMRDKIETSLNIAISALRIIPYDTNFFNLTALLRATTHTVQAKSLLTCGGERPSPMDRLTLGKALLEAAEPHIPCEKLVGRLSASEQCAAAEYLMRCCRIADDLREIDDNERGRVQGWRALIAQIEERERSDENWQRQVRASGEEENSPLPSDTEIASLQRMIAGEPGI
ncbi:hypothetical protein MRY87_05675 [bacterium]|nr:hypothetical protein [bacterium]